jgi:hypothetical protein
MILLKATTETLVLETNSIADIDYSVSYADITSTSFSPSTSEGKITSITSTTLVSAPAASTQRQIKLITISNRHASTTNTVRLKKVISGTDYYATPSIALLAGETVQYMDAVGWTWYSANGSVKSVQTAAGSNTQIQFNNSGATAGSADLTWNDTTNELGLNGSNTSLLITAISSEPAAPSSGVLRIYTKNVGGRILPKWVGPSGIDTPFQPAFFTNNITMWNPTTATAGVWLGTVGAGAGTYTTALPTFTNRYTATKRGRWANVVTTANQVLGQRNTEAMYFRGTITEGGGFFFFARFGLDVWTAGSRLFVGMHTATTVVSADPSASLNILGFGVDAADSAITFMHNDGSGTATKDAIAGQPTLATNQGYDAFIYCKPNDSTVYYRLVDMNTGNEIINSSTSVDLPVASTGLTAGALASNAALTAATATHLGLNRIYVETDY